MARQAAIGLFLVLFVGATIALVGAGSSRSEVNASEPSRGVAMTFSDVPAPAAGAPGRFSPPPQAGSLASRYRATTENITNEYAASAQPSTSLPPATLGTPVGAGEITHANAGGSELAMEGHVAPVGGMRSVLKRNRGPAIEEAAPPVLEEPSNQLELTPATPSPVIMTPPPTKSDDSLSGVSVRRAPSVNSTSVPSASVSSVPTSRRTLGSTGFQPRSIQELALTGRTASLRAEVAGPQSVTAGKRATYVVNLYNDSDFEAQQVQLRVNAPASAIIVPGETTAGEVAIREGESAGRLTWTIPSVAAQSHQTLKMHLTASAGEPFDLSLEWTSQPATAQATISVQQPQLELTLAGPSDMAFGSEEIFTLTVSNPGTGDAENTMVNIASGNLPGQEVEVGTIPAGMKKEIPVQLVASQPGEMQLRAVATADGGLRSEAAGKVLVRKAEVAVHVEGPQLMFAGTEAEYHVTLANTGNDSANELSVALALPAGSKYIGGVEGASVQPTELTWTVPSIPAGTERTFAVQLQLNTMGVSRVAADVRGSGGIAAKGQAETQVEAVTDLKLTVNDPRVPVAVGNDATYELQLVNRGTKAATQVRVVMQFSEGVEPAEADGIAGKIVPGQIVCDPIVELAPGETRTLKVKATADRVGTHQYRVEVTSTEADLRLVSEGTTRFFADNASGGRIPSTAQKPSLLPQPGIPSGLQR